MFDILETPSLILNEQRLIANIAKMKIIAEQANIDLRPHLKTCKSLHVANRILPPGPNSKITVSTLAEADYFLSGGYTDILYAVSIAPQKLARVKALQDAGAKIILLLDNQETAEKVATAGQRMGTSFPCLIEIDCDGKRAGLMPNDPEIIKIARLLHNTEGTSLAGVMTHAGGSYYAKDTTEIKSVAEQERTAITDAADMITATDLPCPIRSAGSTPTLTYADSFNGLTEIRAGVYVFQDMVMQALGVCSTDDIALSVLTTVISHNKAHNRILVDAGSLALSADPGKANAAGKTHFGQVCQIGTTKVIDGLFISSCNQEHGLISLDGTNYTFDDFPISSRLQILPNHACITAAAYPGYHVSTAAGGMDYWPRCSGW